MSEEGSDEEEDLYDPSEEGADYDREDSMFRIKTLDPKMRMINPNEIGFKEEFKEARPELAAEIGGYADQKRKKDKKAE